MTIRGIVFDIGGVLEYTPPTGYLEEWQSRVGIDFLNVFERLAEMGLDGSLGTCTEAEWLAGFRELTKLKPAQIEAFTADLWQEYLGTLNVELVEYIRGLRPNYQTAVLSNSFLGAREKEQEAYGFGELFDDLIYSHEVGLAKPDRRIYELTCGRLGLGPEELVFVDDVGENIEAARTFGIFGVLYRNNHQAIGEIEGIIRREK